MGSAGVCRGLAVAARACRPAAGVWSQARSPAKGIEQHLGPRAALLFAVRGVFLEHDHELLLEPPETFLAGCIRAVDVVGRVRQGFQIEDRGLRENDIE